MNYTLALIKYNWQIINSRGDVISNVDTYSPKYEYTYSSNAWLNLFPEKYEVVLTVYINNSSFQDSSSQTITIGTYGPAFDFSSDTIENDKILSSAYSPYTFENEITVNGARLMVNPATQVDFIKGLSVVNGGTLIISDNSRINSQSMTINNSLIDISGDPIINVANVEISGASSIYGDWPCDLTANKWTLQEDEIINGNLSVSGGLNLSGQVLTVNGNVVIKSGTLNLNGGTLTIDGNLTINFATLNLGGGKLIVLGDVINQYGTFNINGGTADIVGSYIIACQTVDIEGVINYGPSIGSLIMTNESDRLTVGEDFYVYTETFNQLTAGTLEIKGNFTQRTVSNNWYWYQTSDFAASGTHKVLLSGTGLQEVSFDAPGDNAYGSNRFNILEVTNISDEGVVFLTSIGISEWQFEGNVSDMAIRGPTTLRADDEFDKSLTLDGNLLDLNGHNLTIHGDMDISGTLNLNGGTLTVDGNLTINVTTLNLGGGKLIVLGDVIHQYGNFNVDGGTADIVGSYIIAYQTVDIEGVINYGPSNGALVMTNESDRLTVGEDFYVYTGTFNLLTAGTLEIKGNFTQRTVSNNWYWCQTSDFAASGTHKVLLSGTGLQEVSFDAPGDNAYGSNRFNILEVTNISDEGVVFFNVDRHKRMAI